MKLLKALFLLIVIAQCIGCSSAPDETASVSLAATKAPPGHSSAGRMAHSHEGFRRHHHHHPAQPDAAPEPSDAGIGSEAGEADDGGLSRCEAFSFDDGLDGAWLSWANPTSLLATSLLTWDPSNGAANSGAAHASIPFGAPDEAIEMSIVPTGGSFDLQGKRLQVSVKLLSGLSEGAANPGRATLFIKSGNAYDYAAGRTINLVAGRWVTLTVDASAPASVGSDSTTPFDPTDIREIGVNIATGGGASAEPAEILIDTFGCQAPIQPGDGAGSTCEGFPFDDNLEGAWLSSAGPSSLLGASLLTWDPASGSPAPGAAHATVPFSALDQAIEMSIIPTGGSFDLRGQTLHANVELLSGITEDPAGPGRATLFIKSGDEYVYAAGTSIDLVRGQWVTVTVDASSPAFVGSGSTTPFDPSDIREIGVHIATGGSRTDVYQPAEILLDTFVCSE